MQEKRKLDKRELQERELQILICFDQFCKEKHLKYYLAGGTLLGAVRHKGFIPWDDDIDVCMPRPDYEKLVEMFPVDGNFFIKSRSLKNWAAPFAKLLDLSTEVRSIYNEEEKELWIDIFPVDGLPADIGEVEKIYKDCDFYRRLYCLGTARLGGGKTAFRKAAKFLLKPMIEIYGVDTLGRKIEEIAMRHPYETSDYVGVVTWGLYGAGERMKKSEFEKATTVEFEGHIFPAMSCWDSYLTGIYGDYMTPPPPEKRQTHDMVVYVRE